MFKNFLLVASGGAVGAALRYCLVLAGMAMGASGRLSTFFINVVGSFVLGVLTSAFETGSWMLFAGVGLCGAFTTFSTYSVQTVRLLQDGRYGAAALYAVGTVIACLLFAWLGFAAGHKLQTLF